MTKRLASTRSAMFGWLRAVLRDVHPGVAPETPTSRRRDAGRRRLWRAGRVRYLGITRLRDAGMTTAEYAIGTLAACGFAALLVTILRGSVVQGLLLGIIKRALALGG
jgi:hypothetical protein